MGNWAITEVGQDEEHGHEHDHETPDVPDNWLVENCATMNSNGVWNDVDCSCERPCICEIALNNRVAQASTCTTQFCPSGGGETFDDPRDDGLEEGDESHGPNSKSSRGYCGEHLVGAFLGALLLIYLFFAVVVPVIAWVSAYCCCIRPKQQQGYEMQCVA